MGYENPFFVREVRQLARRPRAVQWSFVLCLAAMAGILALWIALRARETGPLSVVTLPIEDLVMLRALLLAHSILCAIAAAYGGFRIFATEHYRSTLESLLILPYTPRRWLALKLAFPVAAVLVAGVAGLSFYLIAALYNALPIGNLAYAMHKPLLAGLGVLCLMLMRTPDYLERVKRAGHRRSTGLRATDKALMIWGLLLAGFGGALFNGLVFGTGLTAVRQPFYGMTAPEWFYWLAMGLPFVLASTTTAVAGIVRTERSARMALRSQAIALLLLYYVGLGFAYPMAAWWMRWLFLAGVPLLAVVIYRSGNARREDAAAARELRWIEARWDNPLLIRDLRVYTRFLSIRRYFTTSCVVLLLFAGMAWGFAIYWGPGGSSIMTGVGFGLCEGLLMGAITTWSGPRLFWYKEWTGQTLPQLLLTPLRSDELLLGRLAAVPLYHWVGGAPASLGVVAAIMWIVKQGYWFAGPVALACSPLLLSVGVWIGCTVNRENTLRLKVWLGDFRAILLRFLQALVLVGCAALPAAAMLPPALMQYPLLAQSIWGCALLLFAANAALTWAWFRLRVRQLDSFRAGDVQLPDSKVMEQQRANARPVAPEFAGGR